MVRGGGRLMTEQTRWCSEYQRKSTGFFPERCRFRANGDDGLCGRHRAGQRKRQENERKHNERWSARDRQWRVLRAQERVVNEWREAHPDQVYAEPWMCPLCNEAIQMLADQDGAIVRHQQEHGEDWQRYVACGVTL